MVVGGDLGDRRGPRAGADRAASAVFAAGLLAGGLAADMAVFVAARAVQGVGGGIDLASRSTSSPGRPTTPRLRPRLFGAISAAWVLPALVGPARRRRLITAHVGWRLVFLGLLPLVAVGLVLVLPAAAPAAPPPACPPPLAGPPLVGGARRAGHRRPAVRRAAARRCSASSSPSSGWLRSSLGLRPLLPAGTARVRRGLPAVVAARGLLAGAFFGMDALLPLALTQLHGYSPAAAGIPLTAGALGWATASQLQGRRPTRLARAAAAARLRAARRRAGRHRADRAARRRRAGRPT